MSQYIFHLLRGLVGYLCKKAKGCDIYEGISVEASHITREWSTVYGNSCGLLHIFWYAERVCKVIGAARRDVSYRYIYLALLHAGHYLVECAVSAAAHYKVILLSIFPDLFYGISLTLCRINGDFVSGLCHDVHDIYQMLLYEPLA